MMYYDEFFSKYGFNDGDSIPEGVEAYRSVYIRGMNALLESHGSSVRLMAYNRRGVHNPYLIVFVDKTFAAGRLDLTDGDSNITDLDDLTLDVGYDLALDEAQDMDFDSYVRVVVTISEDALEDFIVNHCGE